MADRPDWWETPEEAERLWRDRMDEPFGYHVYPEKRPMTVTIVRASEFDDTSDLHDYDHLFEKNRDPVTGLRLVSGPQGGRSATVTSA